MPRPRIVTKPLKFLPHKCIFTGDYDGEIIDFCRDYSGRDPHLYMSRDLLETTGKDLCGMLGEEEATELRNRIEELEAEVAQLTVDREEVMGVDFEEIRQVLADRGVHITFEAPQPTDEDEPSSSSTHSTGGS